MNLPFQQLCLRICLVSATEYMLQVEDVGVTPGVGRIRITETADTERALRAGCKRVRM
jgi:hypothetical protein